MTRARKQQPPLNLYVTSFLRRNELSKSISNHPNASTVYVELVMLTVMIDQAPEDIQQINLAVLGAQGVGKSTFIQHALDIRKPTNGPVSSSKVALSGVTYRFQLLELDLNDIDHTARQIKWPKYINSQLVPPIDGVLCLYDITDQESIAEIPELLRKSLPSDSTKSCPLCFTTRNRTTAGQSLCGLLIVSVSQKLIEYYLRCIDPEWNPMCADCL